MSTLAELQRDMRAALLGGEEAAVAALVLGDGLRPAERLAIYRNNVVASLTAVLAQVFPAVRRLVDGRFFAYAAHEFLTRHPPREACLAAYGDGFPAFLAGFPPCRELVYLADVARLEWLMHAASQAPAVPALGPQALEAVAAEATQHLRFGLAPSLGLIASPWPIDRIWRANRPGAESEETIDLDSGSTLLEVRRRGDDVVMRALPPPEFAFRSALAAGETLAVAAERALGSDPRFDLAAALAELFRESSVVALTLAPAEPIP
ncbi:MAG TPA: DNA-binding domain-containing protein [Alphaproteobacteria bacterium]|nr:DNA-binding domain-containing protein [Alphaproteobacteria bacterium]